MTGTRALDVLAFDGARRERLVLAVGGNALTGRKVTTIEGEFASAGPVADAVADLAAQGAQVVVTHGNGPQVGFILRRSELTAHLKEELPELPLDYCVAETQGGLGYVLASEIGWALKRRGMTPSVVALMTQTMIAGNDVAFAQPTKPVGRFYDTVEAEQLRRQGWRVVEDAGRGYRRVVPSPEPLGIVEAPAVVALLQAGFVVIAAGGGGVPVVSEPDGRLRGVAAVIDKDLASAVLAGEIGAERLVICTAVDRVAIGFGGPLERWLDAIDVAEAERYMAAGEFPAGSMGPKVEAAIRFVKAGGRQALITSIECVKDALEGRAGTRVTAENNHSPTEGGKQ
jgi:carbamate kinase